MSIGLVGIAVILQVLFFYFLDNKSAPFAFIFGLQCEAGERAEYLEICVLWLPVCFLLLYFSNYYSSLLENYGRLILTRSYGRKKLLFLVYKKIFLILVGLVGFQLVLNGVLFTEFLKLNFLRILVGYIQIVLSYLILIGVEILLACCGWENVIFLLLNVYILFSEFVLFYKSNLQNKELFFPWNCVEINMLYKVKELLLLEILIKIFAIMFIVGVTMAVYRRKDIL